MDKIFISDLEVYARHGVLAEERSLGQKFLVSAVLCTDIGRAGSTDDLSASIDYSSVCRFICAFMEKNTYKLIESAAQNLAIQLLIEYAPELKSVELTVKKPWAPIGLPVDTVGVSVTRGWHKAYIALGSNMGDSRAFIEAAVDELDKNEACRVGKVSELIVTKPYGGVQQDDFLNGALELDTLLDPIALLELCHDIEREAGRERSIHWGPRTLDLDILLYDDEMLAFDEPSLIIPHADMINRAFVLEPLWQIAPYALHPVYNKTVTVLLEELRNRQN